MTPAEVEAITRRIDAAAEKALKEAMADLMGRAQRDAPIELGALRASADYGVERTPEGWEGYVSFSAPYAAAQHEGFFNHPRGGKRKYLEDPLKAKAGDYARHIADAVRKAVER